MSFNQIENAILAYAIAQLQPQYEKVYGPYNGHFYLGGSVRFMTFASGPNKGKLTIATGRSGNLPDPNITPVDCWNLMKPGEGIADAVTRLSVEGRLGLPPNGLEAELQAA